MKKHLDLSCFIFPRGYQQIIDHVHHCDLLQFSFMYKENLPLLFFHFHTTEDTLKVLTLVSEEISET